MRIRNYGVVVHQAPSQVRTGGIHPAAELLYLSSGSYRMRWLGNDYNIQSSSLFLISANTPHDLTILSQQANFWYIELQDCEPDFPDLQHILLCNRLQCSSDNDDHVLSDAMQHCIDSIAPNLNSSFLSQPFGQKLMMLDVQKILLFVQSRLTSYKKEADPSRYNLSKDVIKALALHMETNYKHSISLQSLTEIANYQSTYLIKHFKAETGFTPIQYLLQLRMKAAKTYLDTSDMPIKEVAAECGFGSIHHFSGEFKRKFGVYPSEWKRERESARLIP